MICQLSEKSLTISHDEASPVNREISCVIMELVSALDFSNQLKSVFSAV